MDKRERVDRVLAGETVDAPPVSLWYHFGVQHEPGELFARLSLDFFRHYDLDILKVMNDRFYPCPEGIEAVRTADDLRRIVPFDVDRSPWAEQFAALRIIAKELRGAAYFIDTVFDPWQTLRRALAGESLDALMAREPEAVRAALAAIAGNLVAYSLRSLEIGAAGIFLSVAAGRELVSRENFLAFVKPCARTVLEAVAGLGPLTVAHIHGDDLFLDDCLDLPAPVLNWYDRAAGNPSLAAVRGRIAGCVMGGIDHRLLTRRTPAFLRDHVRQARRSAGPERLLLAGGCSIDSSVNPRAIRAIVEAAREPL